MNTTPGFVLGFVLLAASAAAHADKLALPADAPPAFQAECASCHLAFPPQLLPVGRLDPAPPPLPQKRPRGLHRPRPSAQPSPHRPGMHPRQHGYHGDRNGG